MFSKSFKLHIHVHGGYVQSHILISLLNATDTLCYLRFRPPIEMLNIDEFQTLVHTDEEWNFVDKHDVRHDLYVLKEVHNIIMNFHTVTM